MSSTIYTKLARRQNYGGLRMQAVRFIVFHYTGNFGDTAKNNADYFAWEYVGASAHYFVDEDTVWQSVPDNYVAWHCGTKSGYHHPECRNDGSIGVEVCMLDKDGKVRQGSIDNAVKLVRLLMAKYHVTPDRVLRHYDVTHKSCPAPMVDDPALWEAFKNSLVEEDEDTVKYKTLRDVPEWGREAVKAAMLKVGVDGNRILAGNGKVKLPKEPTYAQLLQVEIELTDADLRGICREFRLGLYN